MIQLLLADFNTKKIYYLWTIYTSMFKCKKDQGRDWEVFISLGLGEREARTSTMAAQRRVGQGWRSSRAGQDFRWLRKASTLGVRSSMGRGRGGSSSDLFGRQLEASHSAEVRGKGHHPIFFFLETSGVFMLSYCSLKPDPQRLR